MPLESFVPQARSAARFVALPTGFALLAVFCAGFLFTGCGSKGEPETAKEKNWTSLIDENRAFSDLKSYVELGPASHARGARDQMKSGRNFIKEKLKEAGIQEFKGDSWGQKIELGRESRTVLMENIVGVIPGQKTGKDEMAIAIGCHYDIKILDNFVGANDGASGVALVIELARQLVEKTKKDGKPPFSYYFCFFDGEEAFVEWNKVGADGHPDNCYGSRYMAQRPEEYPIKALILVDLVADKDLKLTEDTSSTAELMDLFLAESKEVFGISLFGDRRAILDDHIPFIDKGVPAIDLIDFNYGPGHRYWHSEEDLVENCSPESLAYVGTLVLSALPKVEKWLTKRLK